MLTILRKHQKILLLIVSILVITSFALFGVFDGFSSQNSQANRTLCKSLTKRPIKEEEVIALTHLLTHSPYALGSEFSLLHDGVIERDFLASGLGKILAEKYQDELREEMENRIEKLQNFQMYEHPKDPRISLINIWKRLAPGLFNSFQELMRQTKGATDSFSQLVNLYMHAMHCPAERARRALFAEQERLRSEADPALAYAQLSPAGFSSYVDWFGSKWLHIVSQTILNMADVAEQQGIKVSRKEAKRDLYRHFSINVAQIQHAERDQVIREFHNACWQLGLHEQLLIKSWRKVLLFRKLLENVAEGVFLEGLPYAQFSAYANESAHVELYSLLNPMPFSDLLGLARWQIYQEAIADSDLFTISLSPTPIAFSKIEQKYPSLIAQAYEITYAEVPWESVACAFSLKEMWQWASEEIHWEKLLSQFPELKDKNAKTLQERFRLLAEWDAKERFAIDRAIQRAMLEKSGNIERALDAAPLKKATLLFGEGTSIHPFSGIADSSAIIDLLHQTSRDASHCFSFDGDVYYRLAAKDTTSTRRVLHFQEAESLLDQWLEQKLEEAYPVMRKRDPLQFRTAMGTERPIKEVKQEFVRLLFAPLLERIEEEYKRSHEFLPGETLKLPSTFYVRYYALSQLQAARDALLQKKEPTHLLKQEILDISRKEGALYQEGMREDTSWSRVVHDPERGLVFFRVLERKQGKREVHKGALLVRKSLQDDAKREWARLLIEEMTKHGAIASL